MTRTSRTTYVIITVDEHGHTEYPGCDRETATCRSLREAQEAIRSLRDTDPETWGPADLRAVPVEDGAALPAQAPARARYAIAATHSLYGPRAAAELLRRPYGPAALTFADRAGARAYIRWLDRRIYHEAHGETGRPVYHMIEVGGRRWESLTTAAL